MIKDLPTQKSSGYTIIEILISVFILVIIFSSVQAGYRTFILQKSLETVKSQIISDLKLAQEYAMSGKKPAGCSGLSGYQFRAYYNATPDNNYYRINAACSSGISMVKEVYIKNIAKQVRFTGADATPYLLFKVIGGGTNIDESLTKTYSLTQAGGATLTITVTPGGEIR